MKIIKVGTRGSRLARIQTEYIISRLKERFIDIELETVIISSAGDREKEKPLEEIGENGIFTSELERSLLRGDIDFAVHSMKDLPSALAEGLCLSPAPCREDARDALVLAEGYGSIKELPKGARIGTGSVRRSLLLSSLRPDIVTVPIRGNIETRLSKVGKELDGVVLAAAGLIRSGNSARITELLSVEEMLPAPAQGILALELRSSDKALYAMLETLRDETADIAARAERAFLSALGAGCRAPVGAYCAVEGNCISLMGLYGEEGEHGFVRGVCGGASAGAEQVGKELALRLLREHEEKKEKKEK